MDKIEELKKIVPTVDDINKLKKEMESMPEFRLAWEALRKHDIKRANNEQISTSP